MFQSGRKVHQSNLYDSDNIASKYMKQKQMGNIRINGNSNHTYLGSQ